MIMSESVWLCDVCAASPDPDVGRWLGATITTHECAEDPDTSAWVECEFCNLPGEEVDVSEFEYIGPM